jgi:RNA polymerase sigma-70 factor (ECF subfamily)
VALRLTANPSDAEEVLQDTFLQVHRHLGEFRGEAQLSTWIHRIAVNAALMHLRARRRRVDIERPLSELLPRFDDTGLLARLDCDYSTAARADELLEKRRLAAAALDAVGRLPEGYRVPFVLRDLEGLETEEVAALTGLDAQLVRQRLHRARLMLRAHLTSLAGSDA